MPQGRQKICKFFYCSDALFGAVVFIVDKYNKEQKGLRARDGGF